MINEDLLCEPTSGHAVVENSEEDEEDVKGWEDNEEKVERIPHLFGGQNKDDEKISNNAKNSDTSLRCNVLQLWALRNTGKNSLVYLVWYL